MKTRTAGILTALLAGVLAIGAYPHAPQQGQPQQRNGRQGPPQMQGQRRGAQQYNRRGQACPQCRSPQRDYRQQRRQAPEYHGRQGSRIQGQRRGAQQYNRRGQAAPQFHAQRQGARHWNQNAPNRQGRYATQQQRQWNPRSQQRCTPQQLEQVTQRRKAALKRFDIDGDGRLSKKERKAAKRAVQQRKGDRNPGESPDMQRKPKNQE